MRIRYLAKSVLLLIVVGLVLEGATPATAYVASFEAQEYSEDFNVPLEQARENLAIQQRGDMIVAELKQILGGQYAGVWFDNEAGEFVVPLLPESKRLLLASKLVQADYDLRTTSARYSWQELENVQADLDKELLPEIESGLVQTSLDPRVNSIVIHEAVDLNPIQEDQIRRAAVGTTTDVKIRKTSHDRLAAYVRACKTTSPRACGRPLRGGVSLTPDTSGGGFASVGECSAGFKALGNDGSRYILTAGHCAAKFSKWGSEDANENWHLIGSVTGYSYPGGDWAKIRADGSSYWDKTPWPSVVAHFWEDQERPIYFEGYSYVGRYVCLSGNKSGTSCGNVSALNVTAGEGGSPIYHQTQFGQVCVQNGDSGGSIFAGNTALGLFSSSDVTGCSATGYYSEITEATAALGVSVGSKVGSPPTAVTNDVSSLRELHATANGQVHPGGLETKYQFQYGTTTSYGSSTSPASVAAGGLPVPVSVTIPNLHAGTTYHYRLVAYNTSGTSYGNDKTFTTTSAPAAVNTGSAINVYLRGSNGSLYQKWCCSGAEGWSSWWSMGSPLGVPLGSGPATAMHYSNVNVYAAGADGNLYQKWCCSGPEGWSSWWNMGSPLGAGVSTSPAAVMHGSNFNVYAGGANDHLYQKWCCSGVEGWSSWWDMGSPPGGGITSSPAAVMHGSNLNVYVRGSNGNLYQKWCCSGPEGWSSWWSMGSPSGGGVTSSPAAVMHGSNLNVYVRGSDGNIYQKWCCSGPEGWSSWWSLGSPPGGATISGPAAVNAGGGVINVYVRGSNGNLYQKWCCSGPEGWSSWWDMGSP